MILKQQNSLRINQTKGMDEISHDSIKVVSATVKA